GQVDATRNAFALDTRSNVDAVAEDVIAVDYDVANIDADAEADLRLHGLAPLGHPALDSHGAGHGIDRAGELHQHAVACRLEDSPFMFGDRRINDLLSDRLPGRPRTDLVESPQAT